MSEHDALLRRLDSGRPLVLSADLAASFAARGVSLRDPAEAGLVVREHAAELADHHHHEVGAGVDVLCAATAETFPRALHRLGMAYRAAALTGAAVDLALEAADAAPRPLLVAGLLGSRALAPAAPDRMAEEVAMHAARLSAAGCHVLIARGFERALPNGGAGASALGRLSRRVAVVSASATGLPTWAVIAVRAGATAPDGEALEDAGRMAQEAGANAVVFELEADAIDALALGDLASGAASLVHRLRDTSDLPTLIALAAAGAASEPDAWATFAKALLDGGARAIAGGPGTTPRHVGALASLLGRSDRPSLFPGAPG